MIARLTWRQPGSPLVLRLAALGTLLLGIVGLASGAMPSFEAGRFYLIALGLYLIAPAEQLPKQERHWRLLLRKPRYFLGVLIITFAIAIIALQFLERMV